MINTISGKIIARHESAVSLSVGPFSFDIQVPETMPLSIGAETMLYIHLHWNQEQGPSLFGFQTMQEKSVFLAAIDCPGVGPKIGLAILADLGASQFVHAIQSEDAKLLSSVSGIGLKRAEQIIVQLKHKIGHLIDQLGDNQEQGGNWRMVTQALESLHYSRPEINQAMVYLKGQQQSQATFDQLLRSALTYLSKKA